MTYDRSVQACARDYAEACIPDTADPSIRSGGEPLATLARELMRVHPPDSDLPRPIARRAILERLGQCTTM